MRRAKKLWAQRQPVGGQRAHQPPRPRPPVHDCPGGVPSAPKALPALYPSSKTTVERKPISRFASTVPVEMTRNSASIEKGPGTLLPALGLAAALVAQFKDRSRHLTAASG